jgi:hypothetical protein
MLSEIEQERLQDHITGIFNSIILPEISPEGCVYVTNTDGTVSPDRVTTHHLVELCIEIDSRLTAHIIDSACTWYSNGGADLNDPFFITTLARAEKIIDSGKIQLIENIILPNQLPSGFIDIYAGFLDGGSVFSTLWAIRNLQLLGNPDKTQLGIAKAFKAIESHWEDVHRSSFKGYYCELKWALDVASTQENVIDQICASQAANGFWDNSPLYTAYVLGNLCNYPKPLTPKIDEALTKGFVALFDLSSDSSTLPSLFKEMQEHALESVYLQTCMRSLISALRLIRRLKSDDISGHIASSIVGTVPKLYFAARALDSRLKEMNKQYGEIQARFEYLTSVAGELLRESPYEQNVFVMMPFRQDRDERYENIERIIKNELRKAGYKGWLASDRNLAPQLWDNVSAFLLACKYGVAVFTRLEMDNRIQEEFNPNVSLELGFLLSRGKKVLILKDAALSKLHTDLVGHLYSEFDLNQVNRQVPKIIRKWVKDLEATTEP